MTLWRLKIEGGGVDFEASRGAANVFQWDLATAAACRCRSVYSYPFIVGPQFHNNKTLLPSFWNSYNIILHAPLSPNTHTPTPESVLFSFQPSLGLVLTVMGPWTAFLRIPVRTPQTKNHQTLPEFARKSVLSICDGIKTAALLREKNTPSGGQSKSNKREILCRNYLIQFFFIRRQANQEQIQEKLLVRRRDMLSDPLDPPMQFFLKKRMALCWLDKTIGKISTKSSKFTIWGSQKFTKLSIMALMSTLYFHIFQRRIQDFMGWGGVHIQKLYTHICRSATVFASILLYLYHMILANTKLDIIGCNRITFQGRIQDSL